MIFNINLEIQLTVYNTHATHIHITKIHWESSTALF